MQRRKFLIGAGSVAAGGAAVMGTGAFSFMQTDRGVNMNVVSDENAFVALTGGDENGAYSDVSSGEIEFNYTDAAGVGGEGLNPQSVYLFDDVAEIANSGTQEVELSVPDTTSDGFWSTNFVAYAQEDSTSRRESIWSKDGKTTAFDDRLNDRSDVSSLSDLINTSTDSITIPTGESVLLGMAFAGGNEGESKSTSITLRATSN